MTCICSLFNVCTTRTSSQTVPFNDAMELDNVLGNRIVAGKNSTSDGPTTKQRGASTSAARTKVVAAAPAPSVKHDVPAENPKTKSKQTLEDPPTTDKRSSKSKNMSEVSSKPKDQLKGGSRTRSKPQAQADEKEEAEVKDVEEQLKTKKSRPKPKARPVKKPKESIAVVEKGVVVSDDESAEQEAALSSPIKGSAARLTSKVCQVPPVLHAYLLTLSIAQNLVAINELNVVTPNPVRVKVEPQDDADKPATSKVSNDLHARDPSPIFADAQASKARKGEDKKTGSKFSKVRVPCSCISTRSQAGHTIRRRQTTRMILTSRSSMGHRRRRAPRAQLASTASGPPTIYLPVPRTTIVGVWFSYLLSFATKAVVTTLGLGIRSPALPLCRRSGMRSTATSSFTRSSRMTAFTQWYALSTV